MKRKTIKKAGTILMTVILAMIMLTVYASAAQHDAVEDVSSDTATLVLGKEMSYINRQYNPVDSVVYRIEKVSAWHNENASTEFNGTPITTDEMPSPSSDNVKINLTEKSDGTAEGKESITIKFSQAGYYVYRITEEPVEVDGADVESDDHSYFAVVYVCNKTDSDGNTIPGVYVHDITSYRNESGSEDYRPDLSDIAEVTDNGGTEAEENTESNLGKVGKSSLDDPDTLEAYRMWNRAVYPEPVDLIVTNNVKGSLGDRTKEFIFDVSISGAEPGGIYVFTGTGAMNETSEYSIYDEDQGTLTADADGNISFTYLMKDDESFTIEDLPQGAEWTATEGASNHRSSYLVDPEECAVTAEDANTDPEMEITAEGALLKDTEADFVNERDMEIVTGLSDGMTMYAGAAAVLLLCALVILCFRVRKKHGHEMEN